MTKSIHANGVAGKCHLKKLCFAVLYFLFTVFLRARKTWWITSLSKCMFSWPSSVTANWNATAKRASAISQRQIIQNCLTVRIFLSKQVITGMKTSRQFYRTPPIAFSCAFNVLAMKNVVQSPHTTRYVKHAYKIYHLWSYHKFHENWNGAANQGYAKEV